VPGLRERRFDPRRESLERDKRLEQPLGNVLSIKTIAQNPAGVGDNDHGQAVGLILAKDHGLQ
jgi:hypothetical protein